MGVCRMPTFTDNNNVKLGKIILKVTDNKIEGEEIEYDITKGDLHLDLVSKDSKISGGGSGGNCGCSDLIGDLQLTF